MTSSAGLPRRAEVPGIRKPCLDTYREDPADWNQGFVDPAKENLLSLRPHTRDCGFGDPPAAMDLRPNRGPSKATA